MSTLNRVFSENLFNTSTFDSYIEPIAQLFKPGMRFKSLRSKITGVSWNNVNTYTLNIKPNKKWDSFTAGQFVQLTVEKNGAYLTRCFSVSSSPQEFKANGEICLTIRRQDNGSVTNWLPENLQKGSTVYLSQAQGEFVLRNSIRPKLFIAGGSGITPILSMLKEGKDKAWLTHAQLIFYVRNKDELLFNDELSELEQYGLSTALIFTDEAGRFSKQQLQKYCADFAKRDVYTCGPEGLMGQVRETCLESGLAAENIHFERFGPSSEIIVFPETDSQDEAIFIHYQASEKQGQTGKSSKAKTLLELAEADGLKPVSGCRIGVCHQCICKKKQGRVYNTKTRQISDSGEEEIQLCLSVPMDHVTLEL